jgi:hypothetical protein
VNKHDDEKDKEKNAEKANKLKALQMRCASRLSRQRMMQLFASVVNKLGIEPRRISLKNDSSTVMESCSEDRSYRWWKESFRSEWYEEALKDFFATTPFDCWPRSDSSSGSYNAKIF